MKPKASLPPLVCGSCTACCHEPPFLDAGEGTIFPTVEEWNPMRQVWQKRLLRGSDGACAYLSKFGCDIYDRRPNVCRRFDCREWYRSHSRAQRRAHSVAERAVFAAAKERGA